MILMDLLPENYQNSPEVVELQQALENAAQKYIMIPFDDTVNQLQSVDTATWSLSRWEIYYKITSDALRTDQERRAIIKSKMRGYGTTTAELIKNILSSFYQCDIKVVEDFPNYLIQVILSMSGSAYFPENPIAEKTIREMLPAHLGVAYIFAYHGTGTMYVAARHMLASTLTIHAT